MHRQSLINTIAAALLCTRLASAQQAVGAEPASLVQEESVKSEQSVQVTPQGGPREAAEVQTVVEPVLPNRHRHLGFYASVQVAGGYRSTDLLGRREMTGMDLRFSGGGPGISLVLGGTVVEDFVVHGELISSLAANPTLQTNADPAARTKDTLVRLVGVGVGATYFFMPLNVYLRASILASEYSFTLSESEFASRFGLGASATAGKQFWLGDELGLELGPLFHFAQMDDRGGVARITSWNLGLAAGVSWN